MPPGCGVNESERPVCAVLLRAGVKAFDLGTKILVTSIDSHRKSPSPRVTQERRAAACHTLGHKHTRLVQLRAFVEPKAL